MSSKECKRQFLTSISPSIYQELSKEKCCGCGKVGDFGLEISVMGAYVLSCCNCNTSITHHAFGITEAVSLDEIVKGFLQAIRDYNASSKTHECNEGPCTCSPSLKEKVFDSLNGRACLEKLFQLNLGEGKSFVQ